MISHDPLQELRDLDSASPRFRNELIKFLRGDEYRNVFPTLQNEDLTWLVEYLEKVSLQTIFLRAALNTGVGSCRYFRSCESYISGTPSRTQEDMRR